MKRKILPTSPLCLVANGLWGFSDEDIRKMLKAGFVYKPYTPLMTYPIKISK